MNKVVISVKNLYKSFSLPKERITSAKQGLVSLFRNREIVKQEVLKGISFDIHEGDFFGIVGRNGSGKSTLLKTLAGIYVPNAGSLQINGTISPFLELGVGFNAELTGKENIYLNGAILGLTKKEIDSKIGEIISFSELENFMDQKLKNYSSGMQVRLAFSVAIHAHAPIILLDEVLAVGDSNFQQKCSNVFIKLKKEGRTIVFVSHSMEAVKRFCNRAILLDKGHIVADGSPEEVAYEYEMLNLKSMNESVKKHASGEGEWGNGKIEINNVTLRRNKKVIDPMIKAGDDFEVFVEYTNTTKEDLPINFAVAIYKDDIKCYDANTFMDNHNVISLKQTGGSVGAVFVKPNLLGGNYALYFSLFGNDGNEIYHSKTNALIFQVDSKSNASGVIDVTQKWEFKQ